MRHWQKALPPHLFLFVLGQRRSLAADMQWPLYAHHYHPIPRYPMQDDYMLTLTQPFLPTFAIAVSFLYPLLTVGSTRGTMSCIQTRILLAM
jgi:hypothetical protein